MSLKVPYLPNASIEASASALLAEYALAEKTSIRTPIPFVPVHSFETPICAYAAIGIGPI